MDACRSSWSALVVFFYIFVLVLFIVGVCSWAFFGPSRYSVSWAFLFFYFNFLFLGPSLFIGPLRSTVMGSYMHLVYSIPSVVFSNSHGHLL